MTFGRVLNEARKTAGLTQRELAARIKKEDGEPISAPYLHDLEHGNRNPPSPHLIKQIAEALEVDVDVLFYWAGVLPDDVRRADIDERQIVAAFRAFRKEINK
jgi:transcriptional regulator with XRE-family HTH domain